MQNYSSRIKRIKKEYAVLQKENFVATSSGTNYKVFLSNKYAVRFRDDNPKILLREAKFLKQFDRALIPRILWSGEIKQSFFMVENRLPGKTINLVWKNLSKDNKKNIFHKETTLDTPCGSIKDFTFQDKPFKLI